MPTLLPLGRHHSIRWPRPTPSLRPEIRQVGRFPRPSPGRTDLSLTASYVSAGRPGTVIVSPPRGTMGNVDRPPESDWGIPMVRLLRWHLLIGLTWCVSLSGHAHPATHPTQEPVPLFGDRSAPVDSVSAIPKLVPVGLPTQHPRLHLTAYPGSLHWFPPYPGYPNVFSLPGIDCTGSLTIAGAYDLYQSSGWRFGVQAEGIYERWTWPIYTPYFGTWRRRITLYGVYSGPGWSITLGVVIHDSRSRGQVERLAAARRPQSRRQYLQNVLDRRTSGRSGRRPSGSLR